LTEENNANLFTYCPIQVQDGLRIQYQNLISRLPPRPHCETLVKVFFDSINWLYLVVDEALFREQFEEWVHNAPRILARGGPEGLTQDFQYFPALLFQMVAQSLQFVSIHDDRFDDLKRSPAQSLLELSAEYSELGVSIASLLGRHRPSLLCVQQEFLRASWLKNAGRMVESWHTIGQAVREAQEIGLHREPKVPTVGKAQFINENLWMGELRKRIWNSMYIWES
jgi:hypothetical protein